MSASIHEQLQKLHQHARDFQREKNWCAAADALLKAKALHNTHWINGWFNDDLPKLLQKAGRFDEALAEIDWLLEHAHEQAYSSRWAHLPEGSKQQHYRKQCAAIHKAAALVCKREKRLDLQQLHEAKEAEFSVLHQQHEPSAKQAYKEHCAVRFAGMPNPLEAPEYKLDRQATAHKKAGNMDAAIAALRQRKALLGLDYRDDKLAKYLQDAGRFDEAMAEIDWLLATCQAYALNTFAHQPTSVIQSQRCHHMASIHAAAVLICQRAQRPDLQALHEQRRDAYQQLRAKLEPVAKADKKQHWAFWENARLAGDMAAMREFARQREQLIAKHRHAGSSPVPTLLATRVLHNTIL